MADQGGRRFEGARSVRGMKIGKSGIQSGKVDIQRSSVVRQRFFHEQMGDRFRQPLVKPRGDALVDVVIPESLGRARNLARCGTVRR